MKQLLESIWNMGAVGFVLVLAAILTPFVVWFVRLRRGRIDDFNRAKTDFDEQRRRVKEELAKARGRL